jgi:VWFA-related protein
MVIGRFEGHVDLRLALSARPSAILASLERARLGVAPADICVPLGKVPLTFKPGLPRPGTSIWDAIECGARALMTDNEALRRVVLVITDGDDTASFTTPAIATAWAARGAAAVYAIGFIGERGMVAERLRAVVDATGGAAFGVDEHTDLSKAFRQLSDELHHQYLLGFVPVTSTPGQHRLTVTTRRRGLTVRARGAYEVVR